MHEAYGDARFCFVPRGGGPKSEICTGGNFSDVASMLLFKLWLKKRVYNF